VTLVASEVREREAAKIGPSVEKEYCDERSEGGPTRRPRGLRAKQEESMSDIALDEAVAEQQMASLQPTDLKLNTGRHRVGAWRIYNAHDVTVPVGAYDGHQMEYH